MAPKKAKSVLSGLKLDAKRYVPLLTKLMAESESLQNNPAQGLYPREDNCSQHVLEALAPYSKEGGPLTVERVSFAEGASASSLSLVLCSEDRLYGAL